MATVKSKRLTQIAELLQRYYSHDLAKISPGEWGALESLREGDAFEESLDRITSAPAGDAEDFEFEFNRLFVGPDHPAAAPYETVYVAELDTLMRETTLSVRDAYARAGMQVDRKNIEPDDHIAFEMAYVAHLLRGVEEADVSSAVMLSDFYRDHLSKWTPGHLAAIRDATGNEVVLGFADLLEALVNEIDEKEER